MWPKVEKSFQCYPHVARAQHLEQSLIRELRTISDNPLNICPHSWGGWEMSTVLPLPPSPRRMRRASHSVVSILKTRGHFSFCKNKIILQLWIFFFKPHLVQTPTWGRERHHHLQKPHEKKGRLAGPSALFWNSFYLFICLVLQHSVTHRYSD